MKSSNTVSHQHRRRSRIGIGSHGLLNWIFLAPMMLFFIGYQVYPILRVLWMSFTDYRFLRLTPAAWVGSDNYRNALADPIVYTGLLRSVEFTVLFLPGTILLPLLLAVLIERVEHERLASFTELSCSFPR